MSFFVFVVAHAGLYIFEHVPDISECLMGEHHMEEQTEVLFLWIQRSHITEGKLAVLPSLLSVILPGGYPSVFVISTCFLLYSHSFFVVHVKDHSLLNLADEDGNTLENFMTELAENIRGQYVKSLMGIHGAVLLIRKPVAPGTAAWKLWKDVTKKLGHIMMPRDGVILGTGEGEARLALLFFSKKGWWEHMSLFWAAWKIPSLYWSNDLGETALFRNVEVMVMTQANSTVEISARLDGRGVELSPSPRGPIYQGVVSGNGPTTGRGVARWACRLSGVGVGHQTVQET